jgi:hypothetical protein
MADSTLSELPPDLVAELMALTALNDLELQAAAKPSLSPVHRRRLDHLSHAGGRRSLTPAESAELEHLLDLYDRAVAHRARALAILAQRGYSVADDGYLPGATDDQKC